MNRSTQPGTAELVGLLRDLVRAHPIYGSGGLDAALERLSAELIAMGAAVAFQPVDQRELERSPHYVDVAAFGGGFASYADLPRRNLVARFDLGAGGPHVVLNGHVDVEFVTAPGLWRAPALWRSGEIDGDRIYGRGTSDMLGGVACYVHTLRRILPLLERARGTLELQLVVDEEVGGNGTLWALMQSPERADVALIAEPTGGLVCRSTRGFHQLRVTAHGDPVHMVFASEFDNAVRSLVEVALCLEELDAWIGSAVPARRGARHVMYGAASAGPDAAMPAASAALDVTLALPPEIAVGDALARLRALLGARLAGRARRMPTIDACGVAFPGSRLTDAALCERIVGHGDRLDVPLEVGGFPSACDARLFEAFGIPAIVFGPGCLSRAHGSDEYVTTGELEAYCDVLGATLVELFNPRGGRC